MDKKQEELQKMYAIRAGLSIVSQNCDAVDSAETEIENAKKTNEEETSRIDELQRYYVGAEKMHADGIKEKLNNYKRYIKRNIITIVISMIISLILIIIWKNLYEANKHDPGVVMVHLLFGALLIIAVGAIIGNLISSFTNNSMRKDYLNKITQSERTIDEYEKQIEDLSNRITYRTKSIYDNDYKFTQIKKVAKEKNNVICEVMDLEYGNLIDKRDWENLDLIIYYYETGRADSVKEALQLVDKERRNDALIEAIGIATNEICQSIHTLGKVMIQGFASLSAQLEAQKVQIAGAMSEILTQQTLNNALLAKANVSSKQMVEQMKTLNNKLK